MHNSQLIV
jgi:brefeldin A-inhibited guanine nucleotide-exchange protein